MATLNDLGKNLNPANNDYVHLWDTSTGTDNKISLEKLSEYMGGSGGGGVANNIFSGTLVQWNELTDLEKEDYDYVMLTDDFNGVPVDSSLSSTSENPVQNKVITNCINDMNNILGAKNLLPYPYYNTSSISSEVTFTDNGDGTIKVNGTATGDVGAFVFINNKAGVIPKGTYKCTVEGWSGNSTIDWWYMYNRTVGQDIASPTKGGLFTYNGTDVLYFRYTVKIGKTVSNLTLKPMIRPSGIEDDTYVPYAKSNKELTEDIKEINSQLGSIDYDGAGAHNSIYRGKYLGAEVTAEQYTAISSGKFTDLYIGDYWTIGGINYRIGAFDYWYNTGDTACTTHHVLLVPDTNLVSGKMNDTNTTTGGYVGSDLKTGNNSNTALATAKSTINNAFGSSHILSHREYFTNAVANGKPSAGAWYDSDIDLMNENMVYGTNIFLLHSDGSTVPNLYTIDKTQIKLFAERPDLIIIRTNWWLRDVVSAAYFTLVANDGRAFYTTASNSYGIRPAFAIC